MVTGSRKLLGTMPDLSIYDYVYDGKHRIGTKMYFIVYLAEESFVTFSEVTWGEGVRENSGKWRGGSKKVIFAMTSILNDSKVRYYLLNEHFKIFS